MSRAWRSKKIESLMIHSSILKTLLDSPNTPTKESLTEKVKAVDKAHSEAHESHIDFLVDDTVSEADKIAAEKEYDEIFLPVMRVLCEGEENLENGMFTNEEDIVEPPKEEHSKVINIDAENTQDHTGIILDNDTVNQDLIRDLAKSESIENVSTKNVAPDSMDVNTTVKSIKHGNMHNKSVHDFFQSDCERCDYEDMLKNNEDFHIPLIHEENVLSCLLCEKRSNKNSTVCVHVKIVPEKEHRIDEYLCNQCEKCSCKFIQHQKAHFTKNRRIKFLNVNIVNMI